MLCKLKEKVGGYMANVAAFFDIDGTIYRDGLIIEVFKKMINYELVDMDRWLLEVKPALEAWDRRLGDYDNYLGKIVDIFKETIKGKDHLHIDWISKHVVEQKGDRVYQYTRKEIERHRSLGHKIITISGSPYELVREMANKYHFDDFRGTIYELDEDGHYTGEIIPMWDSLSKQKAMQGLKEEYGLDLAQCYAYGDTNGDLTMLNSVGHPTAINPSKELLNHIMGDGELKKRINIVVERKDVIYQMDIEHLNYL